MSISNQSFEALIALAEQSQLDLYTPYEKQREFHILGATKRERLLMAGNQTGKSTAGLMELGFHLTGLYPAWWEGRRFSHAIAAWTCAETAEKLRSVNQTRLFGNPLIGEGTSGAIIPANLIISRTLGHGVGGGFDSVSVRHASGGISTLGLKAYAAGRARFASDTLHVVHCDEEAPLDVYTECLARITSTDGIVYTTFTPLNGFERVVPRFLNDDTPAAKRDRATVRMGLKDVGHLTPEAVERLLEQYPPFERKARLEGDPLLGSGAVYYGIREESIRVQMRLGDIPAHFYKLWAIDYGIGHPYAAVLLAYDRERDTIYAVAEIRLADALPADHVRLMRDICPDAPVAWPHDGRTREKSSGIELWEFYSDRQLGDGNGMLMRPDHALKDTEAGIMACYTRFKDGRLLVSDSCVKVMEEFRSYHRDDNGKIVKLNDDLLSALRTGVTEIRYAKQVSLNPRRRDRSRDWRVYRDPNAPEPRWDLFSGRLLAEDDRPMLREFVGPTPPSPFASPLPPGAAPISMADDTDRSL